MKRVYQSSDYYSAQLIKAYLIDNGIETNVSGELLLGAIGEIPANSYPSVWVIHDDDFEKAKNLVEKYEQQVNNGTKNNASWCCPKCHETIEAQFSQCWNCGEIRSDQ